MYAFAIILDSVHGLTCACQCSIVFFIRTTYKHINIYMFKQTPASFWIGGDSCHIMWRVHLDSRNSLNIWVGKTRVFGVKTRVFGQKKVRKDGHDGPKDGHAQSREQIGPSGGQGRALGGPWSPSGFSDEHNMLQIA